LAYGPAVRDVRKKAGLVGVPVNVGEAIGANEVETNESVAISVEVSPGVCVGAVGVPVNAGEARGAAPVTCDTV
jgi:hypothetical protein